MGKIINSILIVSIGGALVGCAGVTPSGQKEYVNIFGAKQAACICADLQAATDSYVAAQSVGDASKMSLAEEAKFLENMETIEPANGLWNKALPIAYSNESIYVCFEVKNQHHEI